MPVQPHGQDAGRLRRRLFLAVWLAVAAALVWPLYPWAAGRLPPILGLPGFFAWPILALAAVFLALVALYRAERGEGAGGKR